MAEFVLGFVKDRVASLFTNEVTSLFTNIHQEVDDIKQELASIQSLLQEADERRDHTEEDVNNNSFRSWLQELREVAFEAEDVVTEYTHYTTQQNMQTEPRGFLEFICEKGAALVSSLIGRRGLASQVHEIKKRLIGIHQRSERYGFLAYLQQGSTSTTSSNVLRRAFPNADEDQVVGIESARDDLIARFVNGSSDLTTISVVGEGGSGKTTLARQVYDRVHQGFQYHAWVVVPEVYDRVELLRKLARALFKSSIPEGLDRMDDQTLTRKMREFLRGKRYFVVFDDVWKEDFWSYIESVLINCNNGGRVMITTRKMKVADFCQRSPSSHTHKMKPLNFEKAWELFCKKVFRSDGCCPTELESLGVQIVKRCGGLPLAILALAGLLSTKVKTVKDWKTFHASLTDELNSDPELKNAIKILSLSYNELPFNLKQCFLYFGMFPKYSNIRNGRLIRQWIAEGFVKEQDDKTAEDAAQDCMDELISRNLVEVCYIKMTGKCGRCRVHDLFHEIILKKSKDTSFFQVKSGSVELINFQRIARRISFVNASNNVLKGIIAPRAHSVVVFSESDSINDVVPIFVTNFKFLKVLDFEDNLGLNCLPEDIGNFFDLRYLSVRRTNVKMLPKSIEKLQNLETLDLR